MKAKRLVGIAALAAGVVGLSATAAGAAVDITGPLPNGDRLEVHDAAPEAVQVTGAFELDPAGGVVPCFIIVTPTGLQIQVGPLEDKPAGPGN
jgi:hypothetical protein